MPATGNATAFNASKRGNGGTHPRTKRVPRQQKAATLKHGATVTVIENYQGRRVAKETSAEIGKVVLEKRGRIKIVMDDGSVFIIRTD